MSKLGYPLTFHPSQQPQPPLPITASSSPASTSVLPDDVDDQASVSSEPPPIDTGLIQCICESTEDDGFTIQCDRCLTWQHAYCMNITQNTIPDRYLCNDCTQRLAALDGDYRVKHKSKGDSGASKSAPATTTISPAPSTTTATATTKRKEEKSSKMSPNGTSNGNNSRSLSNKSLLGYNSSNSNISTNKRSRDRLPLNLADPLLSSISSEAVDSSTSSADSRNGGNSSKNHSNNTITNKPTPKKPKLSKRISVSKRSLQRSLNLLSDGPAPNARSKPLVSVTAKRPTNNAMTKKKEVKYQPTTTNTVKSKFVFEVMKETGQRWKQSPKWKSQPWRPSTTATHHHHHHHHHQGPFIIMDQLSLQQSSATHITIRSLAKQPSSPQQQQEQLHQQQHSRHHRYPFSSCKLRKGAFANTQLNANTFLLEAHGEMLLKSEYKFDAVNDYAILGTPCAHVLFFPTLDLCIDGRRLGNDSRYFRRSCHPNAELRTMVFSNNSSKKKKKRPQQQQQQSTLVKYSDDSLEDDDDNDGDDGWDNTRIRLGLFTRTTIEPGEEITLGWNWQKGHVSWRKNVEWYRSRREAALEQNHTVTHIKSDPGEDTTWQDNTHDDDAATLNAIESMLDRFGSEFGDCACNEHDVCLIERLLQDSSSNGRVVEHQGSYGNSTLQHSRQIIVAPSLNHVSPVSGHHSAEENGDIDVISMSSPSGGGDALQGNTKKEQGSTASSEDELDIDGDIDIGDDDLPASTTLPTPATVTTPLVKNGGQPDAASLSSMSSLSGNESGDELDGKKKATHKKRKLEGDPLTPRSKLSPGRQLPCKKAWMQHYLQRTVKTEEEPTQPIGTTGKKRRQRISSAQTHHPPSSIDASIDPIKSEEEPTKDDGDKKDEVPPPLENDTKSLPDETPDPATTEQQKATATATMMTQLVQTNDTAMDMDLDDGELSDVSSASTIPLDEDDREYRKPASTNPPAIDPPPPLPMEAPSNEESRPQDSTQPEKDDDPVNNKPTKVKVSVQEYLQSRRAANQESPEITHPIP